MSLPIATITILKLTVSDVRSEGPKHKILGYMDESGIPVCVRHYQKAEAFKAEAGDCFTVIGKPVLLNANSLVVESELLMPTTDTTAYGNHILIAGTIAAPRERTNEKAPLNFGLCVDHYNVDTRNKDSYWFNVNLWGIPLDSKRLSVLEKGTNICVTGELKLGQYNNKRTFDVSTRNFQLLPGKPKSAVNGQSNAPSPGAKAVVGIASQVDSMFDIDF